MTLFHECRAAWHARSLSLVIVLLCASSGLAPAVAAHLPRVPVAVTPLDLSVTPSVEHLMAAGQFGGPLYPTADIPVYEWGAAGARADIFARNY